jgi:hypothetical protein
MSALMKADLFPIPEPEKYTGSIHGLKEILDSIKTIPYVGKEWMPHLSHDGCNLGLSQSISVCLKQMEVPLNTRISKCFLNRYWFAIVVGPNA